MGIGNRFVTVLFCCLMLTSGLVVADDFTDWLKQDQAAQADFKKQQQSPAAVMPRKASTRRGVTDDYTAASSGDGWLIMVYMAGDNNLDPFALKDVREMQKVGSSDKLKIVVLLDRVDYGDWTTTRRFLVKKPRENGGKDSWDTSLATCQDLGEKNMGDPATLSSFVDWSSRSYPQPNKMLIIWNHGGGWRSAVSRAIAKASSAREISGESSPAPGISRLSRGIAWDDTNGGDFLEMREVRQALEETVPLSVIGADACLMGMVEVAYELRDQSAYFIGSENIEPGDGWPYDRWLPVLQQNTAMPPDVLCRLVVDEYAESYGTKPVTLSAVRLALMPKLAKSIDDLACELIDYSEKGTKPEISFKGLPWYSPSSPEFVDLGAFLSRLQRDYSGRVRKAASATAAVLREAVLANKSHPDLGGQGLSIYPGGGSNDRDYRAGIIQFARDTRWDELLRELAYKHKEETRNKLATGRPNRWAVLIGVEDYTDKDVNNLNYSVDDVVNLRKTLIKYAGYQPDHIKVLTNSLATAASVRSTLGTWLPRQVTDDDMVLIYFSGHGGVEPSIRGDAKDGTEKYMMLSDSRADDMYGTAIPMSELSRIFARIRARKLLFAMDSCYSGATGKGVMRAGMKAAVLSDNYLNAMAGSSGTVVLTASRANEVSMEAPRYSMGLFTHFMAEGLSGRADYNEDGLISVVELFQYLNACVPAAARKLGASQHPVMKGEISGSFPVAVVK